MATSPTLPSIENAALALGNLILVTPDTESNYQPQSTADAKPPTLVFHYEGENKVTLKADITDHYVEDNTAFQDQISIKPVTIQTSGFIGELNDIVPTALKILKKAAEKLTVIGAYTPSLSITALRAYNVALLAYETAASATNSAVSAWSSITGDTQLGSSINTVTGAVGLGNLVGTQTKQAVMFQQFQGYFNAPNRTLFKVQTPWGSFDNCAIETLTAVQDADTRMISNFEVTFKQIRLASTITIRKSYDLQGRAIYQAVPETSLGDQTLVPTDAPFRNQFSVTG